MPFGVAFVSFVIKLFILQVLKSSNINFNTKKLQITVADPDFDLRGAWTLSTGGGGECRKSLKVLKAEVKVILSVFLARFL